MFLWRLVETKTGFQQPKTGLPKKLVLTSLVNSFWCTDTASVRYFSSWHWSEQWIWQRTEDNGGHSIPIAAKWLPSGTDDDYGNAVYIGLSSTNASKLTGSAPQYLKAYCIPVSSIPSCSTLQTQGHLVVHRTAKWPSMAQSSGLLGLNLGVFLLWARPTSYLIASVLSWF